MNGSANLTGTTPRRTGWRPLTYTLNDGNEQRQEPPFMVGIVADVAGHGDGARAPLRDRRFKYIDADNINDSLADYRPKLHLEVRNRLLVTGSDESLRVDLAFASLDDFRPECVCGQIPQLAALVEKRSQIAPLLVRLEIQPQLSQELTTFLADADVVAAINTPGLPSQDEVDSMIARLLLKATPALRSALSFRYAKPMLVLTELAALLQSDANAIALDKLHDYVRNLDARLATQLDEVVHHDDFRRLEATWRGIAFVVRELELSSSVKVRLFDATMDELHKDFKRSMTMDQSVLFRHLNVNDQIASEYGPFTALVFDFELTNSPLDIAVATNISHIAKAMTAPALFSAAPALLMMDSWAELWRPRHLYHIFDSMDYAPWRALRDGADTDHLVVVLPRLLARPPWDTRDAQDEHGLAYLEQFERAEDYCWMSGAYGLATVLGNAFARDRWFADLRGPRWGRVDGVVAEHIVESGEIVRVVGPVEVDISEFRHEELCQLGLTTIARDRRGDFAAFPCPVSLCKLPRPDAGADVVFRHARLEHILCIGRIHHVVKCYLKDHSGLWAKLDEATAALEIWLLGYCVQPDDDAPAAGVPLPPFKTVKVKLTEAVRDSGRAMLKLEIVLNYVTGTQAEQSAVRLSFPFGFASGRLIP